MVIMLYVLQIHPTPRETKKMVLNKSCIVCLKDRKKKYFYCIAMAKNWFSNYIIYLIKKNKIKLSL